jgi:hypothetical protein
MPPHHPRWKFDFGDNIVIFLQVMSKKINSIMEDMMRGDNISRQMLKNPFVKNKNKKNVQKKSLIVAPRKWAQKAKSKLINAP